MDCRVPCPCQGLQTLSPPVPLCYLEGFSAHSVETHLKNVVSKLKNTENTVGKVNSLHESGRILFVMGVTISSFLGLISSTFHEICLYQPPLKPHPHGQVSSLPKVHRRRLALQDPSGDEAARQRSGHGQ